MDSLVIVHTYKLLPPYITVQITLLLNLIKKILKNISIVVNTLASLLYIKIKQRLQQNTAKRK